MLISVINLTTGAKAVTSEAALSVVRAVNRQLREDFLPYWHIHGQLRLDPPTPAGDETRPHGGLRGDGILYLMTSPDQGAALGYHARHHDGVPFGFVFTELSERLGEPWSVTLSHEALELIADPDVNLLCKGPHPDPEQQGRDVFHWFEICDAVQTETYAIDGVAVSNFVLPSYFTGGEERSGQNDFLSTRSSVAPPALRSFGTNPGGYCGFFEPDSRSDGTWNDPRPREHASAKQRADIKKRLVGGLPFRRQDRRPLPHPTDAGGGLDVGPAPEGGPAPATPPAFEAFVVRVGPAPQVTPAAVAKAVAKEILGPGWKVQPFDPAQPRPDFVVLPPIGERQAPGDAWELAYRLRQHRNVVQADPLFAVPPPGFDPSVEQRRASGSNGKPLPGAQADCEWSVKVVKAEQAWTLSPEKGAKILIGHPDTGYTEHPEILPSLDLERQRDFVDDDGTATDPLDGGLLLFPSHGTGTASVIVSGKGSPSEKAAFVTGIAPGARVVPIRVSKSVIHLSMLGVTKAIRYATDKGCHVISMSLGGPFGWWFLHDAVRYACDRGVIVLAAAGNDVHFVTYPAAFDEVIAVAGCNAELRPWSGSCRGSAVDITAPGESVWRAQTQKTPQGSAFEVAMGNGTSFAVATVAGIAALWLAHHGREKLVEQYGAAGVPAVFKDLLIKTCQRPPGWDQGNFGAGIADAGALLAAALPAAPPARGMRAAGGAMIQPVDTSGLRKILHLFEDLEPARLRAALSAFLSVSDQALDARLETVGDELAMHLGLSAELRDTVRALAAGRARRAAGPDAEALRRLASRELLRGQG